MLTGTADKYSTGIQQMAIPLPYQDQVQALGLSAWKKFDEGPAKSPILGIIQKATKDLPSFIDRIHKSLKRTPPQRSSRAMQPPY